VRKVKSVHGREIKRERESANEIETETEKRSRRIPPVQRELKHFLFKK